MTKATAAGFCDPQVLIIDALRGILMDSEAKFAACGALRGALPFLFDCSDIASQVGSWAGA